MKLLSFKFLRPATLFCCMVAMFAISTHQRIYSRSWHEPLDVTVYPINGDGTLATRNYILDLQQRDLQPIDNWFAQQAARYPVAISDPIKTRLGPAIKAVPPRFPANGSVLETVLWGLKLRFWAYRNTPDNQFNLRHVRMFVVYTQGADNKPLPHSVGLQKGLIGVVNAYSLPTQTAQNNIVIAHELLHTVGASDKYDFYGNPIFPKGFANVARNPIYPQRFAEIMAARIPVNSYASYMANSLRSTQINEHTAREIAWLE